MIDNKYTKMANMIREKMAMEGEKIINNFTGAEEDKEEITKFIKNRCEALNKMNDKLLVQNFFRV